LDMSFDINISSLGWLWDFQYYSCIFLWLGKAFSNYV